MFRNLHIFRLSTKDLRLDRTLVRQQPSQTAVGSWIELNFSQPVPVVEAMKYANRDAAVGPPPPPTVTEHENGTYCPIADQIGSIRAANMTACEALCTADPGCKAFTYYSGATTVGCPGTVAPADGGFACRLFSECASTVATLIGCST